MTCGSRDAVARITSLYYVTVQVISLARAESREQWRPEGKVR